MIKFGIVDFIDIVAVALLLYYIYKLMKESSSANIFSGILVFIQHRHTPPREPYHPLVLKKEKRSASP